MTDTAHSALQIAQTLAFGIPPPYGVIAAGALQLFGMLLPSSGGGKTPNQVLLDAIDNLRTDLLDQFQKLKLEDANALISSMTATIQQTYDNWDKNKYTAGEFKTLIDEMKRYEHLREPDRPFLTTLAKLPETVMQNADAGAIDIGETAMKCYAGLLVALVTADKTLVELQAGKLAVLNRRISRGEHVPASMMNDEILNLRKYFNRLVEDIQTYSGNAQKPNEHRAALQGLVNKVKDARVSCITLEQDGENYVNFINVPYAERHYIRDKCDKDSNTRHNETGDTIKSEYVWAAHRNNYSFTCLKNSVETSRVKEYIPGKKSEIDERLKDDWKTLDALYENVQTEADQIKPEQPASRPSVKWIDCEEGYFQIGQNTEVSWGVHDLPPENSTRENWSSLVI